MKLKNILSAILLVLFLSMTIFAMTACTRLEAITDKDAAIELLIETDKKMDDLKSYSMEVSGKETESGVTTDVDGFMKITEDKIAMEMTATSPGIIISMNIYYKDGFLYTMFLGSKMKMEVSIEDAFDEISEYLGSSAIDDDYEEYNKLKDDDYVFEGKVEKNHHVFTFTKGDDVLIYKINSDGYFTYISIKEDGSDIVTTINLKKPTIKFPDDLNTYELQ